MSDTKTTAERGSREWIARLIRTERLRATRASAIELLFSPDAPAEEPDLLTADLILSALPSQSGPCWADVNGAIDRAALEGFREGAKNG